MAVLLLDLIVLGGDLIRFIKWIKNKVVLYEGKPIIIRYVLRTTLTPSIFHQIKFLIVKITTCYVGSVATTVI